MKNITDVVFSICSRFRSGPSIERVIIDGEEWACIKEHLNPNAPFEDSPEKVCGLKTIDDYREEVKELLKDKIERTHKESDILVELQKENEKLLEERKTLIKDLREYKIWHLVHLEHGKADPCDKCLRNTIYNFKYCPDCGREYE